MVKSGEEFYSVGGIEAKSNDTTGAGDLYASGFLYGLINGLSLDKCGYAGSILSGKVIEMIGPKINDEKWVEAREMIWNL